MCIQMHAQTYQAIVCTQKGQSLRVASPWNQAKLSKFEKNESPFNHKIPRSLSGLEESLLLLSHGTLPGTNTLRLRVQGWKLN